MEKPRTYPGKLLLFGEYTTLLGSSALAMPLSGYSGHWQRDPDASAPDLLDFCRFLQAQSWPLPLDTAGFEKALGEGLTYASNIPIGYGLGSSGALCAAVWDRFGQPTTDLPLLRQILARMEGFFHGSSSGSDPLVSYLNRPLLFQGKKAVRPLSFSDSTRAILSRVYLLNTGYARQTAPLVDRFIERQKQTAYRERLENELRPLTEQAIRAFLDGSAPALQRAARDLSRAQLKWLPDMIPADLLPIWKEGIASGRYAVKLCGAGGGGFMLVFFSGQSPPETMQLGAFPLSPVRFNPPSDI